MRADFSAQFIASEKTYSFYQVIAKRMASIEELYFTQKPEWRAWLEKNYQRAEPVWLIFFKKECHIPTLTYDDSVEQALCFGWIDGIVKSMDHQRYKRKFMPRSNVNNWSDSNKKRTNKLIASGEMTLAGLNKIGDYAQTGILKWPEIEEVVISDFSPDLRSLLESDALAFKNFVALTNTQKNRYINWIMQAKREETRARRMNEAIALLNKNVKNLLK